MTVDEKRSVVAVSGVRTGGGEDRRHAEPSAKGGGGGARDDRMILEI